MLGRLSPWGASGENAMKSRGKADGAHQARSGALEQASEPARPRRTRSGMAPKGERTRTSGPPGNGQREQPPVATGRLGNGSAKPAGRRRFSLRGSAPWAARHAAKHAAETAARHAAPVVPGSARATLRTPAGAEDLKERVRLLHSAVTRIAELRRNMAGNFYQIGLILRSIRDERLYDAKGYFSFEAFAERETGLGKLMAIRLSRVPSVFHEEAAASYGLAAILAALDAMDDTPTRDAPAAPSAAGPPLPAKPPQRRP
jgi:hypothetical protein